MGNRLWRSLTLSIGAALVLSAEAASAKEPNSRPTVQVALYEGQPSAIAGYGLTLTSPAINFIALRPDIDLAALLGEPALFTSLQLSLVLAPSPNWALYYGLGMGFQLLPVNPVWGYPTAQLSGKLGVEFTIQDWPLFIEYGGHDASFASESSRYYIGLGWRL